MTPRHEPSILELAAARHDWANRDPMNVALPLKPRKQASKRQQPSANQD